MVMKIRESYRYNDDENHNDNVNPGITEEREQIMKRSRLMYRSDELLKARITEQLKEKKIRPEERPAFHLTPRAGWMNDPNGFSWYQGEYHMFYQYNPYDTQWGPMHWGHAVTKDLIRWENRPCALAPDTFPDREAGCFSGGAAELPDGRHLLMYTGCRREKHLDGTICDVQTQNLAIGDGVDYQKYPGNPVLSELDLPEGASRIDFRDPKIWRESDGSWRCVVANRAEDETGQLLLFTSPDAFHWSYLSKLAVNHGRFGRMWECPDYFLLDGKSVILMSPQDMEPDSLGFHAGNNVLCMIGHLDEEDENGGFREEFVHPVDDGIDFYATQTVLSPDGRRILTGWMQSWDTVPYRVDNAKWFGQVSLPRELTICDGRLIQKPVRELEQYRTDKVERRNVAVDDSRVFTDPALSGRIADLIFEIRPEEDCREVEIRFAEDGSHYCSVTYRPQDQTLTIDRSHSGVIRDVLHSRTAKVSAADGSLKLRMILDRFSAEIFVNDGETVMSMTHYSDLKAEGISVRARGEAAVDITRYLLNI